MEERILRGPAVERRTGLSRTTVWRLEKKDKFPRRIQLSDNAVGWLESEIDLWIERRAARRPGEVQPQHDGTGGLERRPEASHPPPQPRAGQQRRRARASAMQPRHDDLGLLERHPEIPSAKRPSP